MLIYVKKVHFLRKKKTQNETQPTISNLPLQPTTLPIDIMITQRGELYKTFL